MPSSYTTSARFTLQATGENNNTWGVILNQGVFQLVDDNINGRLAFALSGVKVLTTNLGATDEARMQFLDVTGGTGGTVTVPAVSQGHFVRNASSGNVAVSAGGAISANFGAGDIGPVFSDGANVYGLTIAGLSLRNYIASQVTGGSDLPPPTGNLGKVMIVRNPGPVWIPDFIQTSDVAGLQTTLDDLIDDVNDIVATVPGLAIAFAVAL